MNKPENGTATEPQTQQPSQTFRTVAGVITALLLFIAIALPYVIQLIIVDQLEKQGADQVNLEDVDLNLLTGKFSIHGLEVTTKTYPALRIEQLSVAVPYWRVISNQITISDLLLRDAMIPVVQLEDGSMVIGLPLPAADENTAEHTSDQNPEATPEHNPGESPSFDVNEWRLTLQNLRFENVTIQLISEKINNAFEIEVFEIKNLTNWSEERSQLRILTSISSLEKSSAIQINAKNISLETNQKVSFTAATNTLLVDLAGQLSVESSALRYENFSIKTQLENSRFELSAGHQESTDNPLSWHLKRFQITRLNTEFDDQNVEPAFSTNLEIQSLLIEEIDSQLPNKPTTIALNATIDRHSEISLSGSATPLAEKISADIEANINSLELVPLSSYIDSAIGYHIHSGKLNLATNIKVDNNKLDSKAGITLNNIKLTPASEKAAEKLTKQLTMPLDLVLSVLRDKENNVRVEIPVRGDINNPDFDINDVLQQATGRATKYAALSFLKNALQPYTTMITIAEFAYDQGKSLTALRLDPLIFQPQQLELSENHNHYLNKIAELIQQRPELRIRLCGVGYIPTANEKDRTDQDKEAQQAITQQAIKSKALDRAKQLANQTKNGLIEQHGVSSDRLFSCQPTTEPAKKDSIADARVDLLL